MNITSYQHTIQDIITSKTSVAVQTGDVTAEVSFTQTLKRMNEEANMKLCLPSGNVTFTRQSLNYNFDVDMTKSKDAMTLDEYKMYMLNKFSQIKVSSFTMTHVFGPMTITEDCFIHMKADAGFESIVLSTMKLELTTTMADGLPACYGEYTFGGTVDEIQGTAYTIDAPYSSKKSYWEIRMEKIKEALKQAREKADEDNANEHIYDLLCSLIM